MGNCQSQCPNGTCSKAANCTCAIYGASKTPPDAEGQARVEHQRQLLHLQTQLCALHLQTQQVLEHFLSLLRSLSELPSVRDGPLPAAPSPHACTMVAGHKLEPQLVPPEGVVVQGAGRSQVDGTYMLTEGTRGGRPIYQHTGDSRCKIQWSTKSSLWIIDIVGSRAPYKASSRKDMCFPQDARWTSYQGGIEPYPTVVTAGAHATCMHEGCGNFVHPAAEAECQPVASRGLLTPGDMPSHLLDYILQLASMQSIFNRAHCRSLWHRVRRSAWKHELIEARKWRAELQSLLLNPSTCLVSAKHGTITAAEPRWIRCAVFLGLNRDPQIDALQIHELMLQAEKLRELGTSEAAAAARLFQLGLNTSLKGGRLQVGAAPKRRIVYFCSKTSNRLVPFLRSKKSNHFLQ